MKRAAHQRRTIAELRAGQFEPYVVPVENTDIDRSERLSNRVTSTRGSPERHLAYDEFMHFYNHHRSHGALGWHSPTATLVRLLGDNVPVMHT